jgi:hypothetical protein
VNEKINGTASELSSLATNILFPGSHFILSIVKMANGFIQATAGLLEIVINAFKVADDFLSMNPTA